MTFLDKLPKPFFALAPMDDVTDTVFRQVVASCAPPDLFFSEFVNVDGLQSPGRPRLLHKLQFTSVEKPIIAQIWGLKPENFYKTAKEIKDMGFDGVDLNMGCPVKTIIKNGACAALINNRGLTEEILQAVREGVGPDFPVSVKTRVGFTTVDLSWLEFLLKSPSKLNMLTIHGRTAKQMSKVPADWDLIGQVAKMRSALASPALIVGNGDVRDHLHGLELSQRHGLDGIMIGRGVFNDPFVFTKSAEGSPWAAMSKQQKIDLYTLHVKQFANTYKRGERKIHTLNKFCKIYIEGFPGAKELREQLMSAESSEELLGILEQEK